MLYYAVERAKGGVGLIIMGATAVNQDGWHGNGYALNDSDRIIPIYRKIADSVHAYDTKIFDQLFHAGGQLGYGSGQKVWAPSAVAHSRTVSLPVELSIAQIQSIIQDYANAAKRSDIGGLDGVEIAGTQGFLVDQFVSPRFNQRQDMYGGDFDRRMRFPIEVLERVRDSVREDFVVGYRITADALEDGDLTLDDSIRIVETLESRRLIDYISVTAGVNSTLIGYWLNHGDMSVPLATFSELSATIREHTHLPVLLACKIKHPSQAEYLIERGYADMLAMTRAHIADPRIVNKVKSDAVDDICPCISCNQACVGGNFRRAGVKCVLNPATGREKGLGIGTLIRTSVKKRVIVVGGGAAGMEFARIAASRGHSVALYEQEDTLGGQLLLASVPRNRCEFEDAVNYLVRQIDKLGIDVHLGTKVTADTLCGLDADVVVLATGALDRLPYVNAEDDMMLTTGWKALSGVAKLGKRVLIVDGDWRQHALSIGEHLVEHGKDVEIVTSALFVGKGLDMTNIASFASRLLDLGARLTPMLEVDRVLRNRVVLRHVLTGKIMVRDGIDNVVFVVGPVPNRKLHDQVKERLSNVITVGDCNYPRGLDNATYEAHVMARTI